MEPAYDINNPDKKNAWKMIQGMLTRGQHNDAFAIALNVFEEDELPLIKILSKLKCKFPFKLKPCLQPSNTRSFTSRSVRIW